MCKSANIYSFSAFRLNTYITQPIEKSKQMLKKIVPRWTKNVLLSQLWNNYENNIFLLV